MFYCFVYSVEPFSLFLQKGKLSQPNNGTYETQSVSEVLSPRSDREKLHVRRRKKKKNSPVGFGLNEMISNEELLETIKRQIEVYEI